MPTQSSYIRSHGASAPSSIVLFTFFCSLLSFFSLPQATCLTHRRTGFRTRSWYYNSSCWPNIPSTPPSTGPDPSSHRPPAFLLVLAMAVSLSSYRYASFGTSAEIICLHLSNWCRTRSGLFTLCNAVICCIAVWNLVLAQQAGWDRAHFCRPRNSITLMKYCDSALVDAYLIALSALGIVIIFPM